MSEKRRTVEMCIKNYLKNEYGIEKKVKEEEFLVKTLGIDSLGILKLAIKVEEELGIVVPDEELVKIGSFNYGELLDFFATRY